MLHLKTNNRTGNVVNGRKYLHVLSTILLSTLLALPAAAENDDAENKSKKGWKNAGQFVFKSQLSGAQETPNAADTEATGRVRARFARDLSGVHIRLKVSGINSMVVAGHFHCALAGLNGPVAVGLLQPGPLSEIGADTQVTLTNDNFTGADCTGSVGRPVTNIASLYFAMREGMIYLNLHTPDYPGGELRGQMLPAR